MSMESLTPLIFFCSLLFSILELSFASDTITPTQPMNYGETLISANQTFELGFFSPGNSKKYLGIWYKNSPEAVVWIANRNNPITDANGVLTFSNDGNLVLLDHTRSIIWSSNTSLVSENPVAQLLDSGNFVLIDNFSMSSENYLWQSFDYPSDTLLPGMKLGWNLKTGRERYLTSWRSVDDPSPGDFTYRLDIHGLPQLVIGTGSRKLYRTGPWNGIQFSGIPVVSNLVFKPMLVWNENELYYTYEAVSSTITMRLTLNQSGSVQRLLWDGRTWGVLYSVPFGPCDNYGRCGANGICRISKTPICGCSEGFIPKSQDEQGIQNKSWSKNCVRELPLDCQRDRFVQLTGVKLPDLLEVWLDNNINLTECKAKCLKNCSCTAYTNSNIIGGGRGCLMWFSDLIDLREVAEEYKGQHMYIRLPASKSESMHDSNKKEILQTSLVVSTISSIFILGLVFCIIWMKRNQRGMKGRKEDTEVPLFDFATIAAATNNFSEANIIGIGGFGPVYKGNLLTGQEIAVKRRSKNSGQGVEEFRNEIILIAQLQHRNLVGLLGSCIQGEERMLIYEYMPNKSLDYFIFGHKRSTSLAWEKRFDIVMGISRGLLYLHQDSKLQIIHRDLKASNILLDSYLNPKISDFGLARIFEGDDKEASTKRVVGTYGYMSPEYAIEGTFSVKSDVYSLGVLLLEIVSGKKNKGFSHPNHHHNLLGHAWLLWCEDRALELMDTCLEESCIRSQVFRCVHVGLLCVQKFPEDRPAMSSVVFMLANEGATLPQPKEPGFFAERSSIDVGSTSSKEISHTGNAVTITMLEGR